MEGSGRCAFTQKGGLDHVWGFAPGFRAGYQPFELTRSVMGLVEKAREWKQDMHLVKTDLTQAYDKVTLQNAWAAPATKERQHHRSRNISGAPWKGRCGLWFPEYR